jgi:hypothetical protein
VGGNEAMADGTSEAVAGGDGDNAAVVSGATGNIKREFGSRTASVWHGAAVVCDAAGDGKGDFGMHTANVGSGASAACDAAGNAVCDFGPLHYQRCWWCCCGVRRRRLRPKHYLWLLYRRRGMRGCRRC